MKKDLYENLSTEQKEVLKQFSKEMTIKKTNLMILRDYKGNNWTYNGYYDTGFFGGGCCANGHKLRYIYEAINDNGDIIEFGEKCIREFFKVSDATINEIKRGTKECSKLIKEVVDMVNENKNNINEIKKQINYIGDEFNNIGEDNIHIVEQLLSVNLPIPWWIESKIFKIYEFIRKQKEFEKLLTDEQQGILIMGKMLIDKNSTNTNIIILNNLYDYYSRNKYLTVKQLELLNKLVNRLIESKSMDEEKYIETMSKLRRLSQCKTRCDEKDFIYSLMNQLESNKNLSDKQLEIIDKKMYRYREQLKNIH